VHRKLSQLFVLLLNAVNRIAKQLQARDQHIEALTRVMKTEGKGERDSSAID